MTWQSKVQEIRKQIKVNKNLRGGTMLQVRDNGCERLRDGINELFGKNGEFLAAY